MKRAWKILGIVLAAMVLAVGAVAIWVGIVADRRVGAMTKDVAALLEEIEKRNPSRAPLRGAPIEGNAWVDYDQAMGAVPRADLKAINALYDGRSDLDPVKVAELLASGDAAFDHFRRGTRKTHGAYPYIWQDGVTGKCPSMFDCQTLARFSALRARRLLEEGKAHEAAELMLDTCRFGQDLSTNTFMIYHWIAGAIYYMALDELRTILKSKDLSREDFLAIERELDQLGRDWPDAGDAAANDALASGYELMKPWSSRDSEVRASLPESWRFGFSRRIAEVDAFDELRMLAREFAGLSRRPWSEAQKVARELEERIGSGPNPLTDRLVQWSASNIEYDRGHRTHLQLLRGAARFRATSEAPDLDDPFGGKLRTEISADRLKLWSVGRDGVDDAGSGEWKPRAGKDIVLEVRR